MNKFSTSTKILCAPHISFCVVILFCGGRCARQKELMLSFQWESFCFSSSQRENGVLLAIDANDQRLT